MPFGPIEGNDGGLLELTSGLRKFCDEISRLLAEHNGLHADHGLTDCDSIGPLVVAHMLCAQGAALAASGANMLEALLP